MENVLCILEGKAFKMRLKSKQKKRDKAIRLHTAINRAEFVSWCMLYTYKGTKMAFVRK